MQILITTLVFAFFCCSSETKDIAQEKEEIIDSNELASVIEVNFSGGDNNYTFSVTIASPDTGCDQYADWWEVTDLQGNLIYRRILAHSHVNEQPFTRSGGPVEILKNTEVYVRVHMNNTSYGSKVMKGSVNEDFTATTLDSGFAKNLENQEPQPNGCAF
ncbi:hypothetical protein [uncultured Croceitalea sp.]|uniref:hypothetical protein n=1 Tax=uncultured Croceitalea sp. TaxID=1798908 RepID=UPI00374E68C3